MKRITCLAIVAMVLCSCHQSERKANLLVTDEIKLEDQKPAPRKDGSDKEKTRIAADSSVQESNNEPPLPKEKNANTDWDKKIIKTADVTLELKDFNAYNKSIHQGLKAYGAYVAQEEQTQNENATENNITIKVPVERFDDLMNSFSGDGIKVLQRKISTEDVTGEVVDTKGRIETKKQVRLQYMELLKQAKNMKDILEVQNEINGITEEVEAAGGRVQYLVHQAAYSTIHLKYLQYNNGVKPIDETPGFFSKLKEAFKSGGNAMAAFAIFLANIWPIILLAVIGFTIIKRRNKTKPTIKQEAAVH